MRTQIIPKGPHEYLGPPLSTLTPTQWRDLNTWKWHLWQAGIDPRDIEWPGHPKAPEAPLRLLFAKYLYETGRIAG